MLEPAGEGERQRGSGLVWGSCEEDERKGRLRRWRPALEVKEEICRNLAKMLVFWLTLDPIFSLFLGLQQRFYL
jgi:hypothetical protein